VSLREIQAGRRGLGADLVRAGLSFLSLFWRLGLVAKGALRAVGIPRTARLPVPVICVGNLVAGGTGKTPLVAWLATRLRAEGRHVGILARGYGPRIPGTDLSDEGILLQRLVGPDVPQVQDGNRARGGRRLLAEHPKVDVILLDDGFQHRRLARDLDVVLLDASNPFGFRRLLPRGLLREPPSALARAGAVVVTRAERVDAAALDRLKAEVKRRTAAPLAVARTRPVAVEIGGIPQPPERLLGRAVFVCCGIGNPQGFAGTVRDLHARVVGVRDLGDHVGLSTEAWAAVVKEARALGADLVVTTRKDAVKVPSLPPGVAVLDVETHLVEGERPLLELIRGVRHRSSETAPRAT
jgi:tetraacyldisaccharide 4'-kinase